MRRIVRPAAAGIATVAGYLAIVVLTTPALPAEVAIIAAIGLNSVVIAGMGIGIGLQVYLAERGRALGCGMRVLRGALGGNSGGAAATSFFSFFSLVPLGCCGWWLYVLSLLPSVFGTGISAVLIEYSQPLAYLGLIIIFGFNGVTAYRLRRETASRRLESLR